MPPREKRRRAASSGGSVPVSADPASRRSLQQRLEVLDGGPGPAGERGGLEVGEEGGQAVVAADPSGGGEGAVDADEVGGDHEELGAVEGEVVGRGRGLGPVHAHQAGAPVVVDHDPSAGEVAVGDAGGVQPVRGWSRRRRARASSISSGSRSANVRPGGLRTTSRASSRAPAMPTASRSGTHGPAALGQEEHQGLVLDLLAPAQGRRWARRPCTRPTARAWRTAGRRCCPGRRPRRRAGRRCR